MKQSLYFCLSEQLEEIIPIMDDGSGPTESYRIAELVVAPTRDKAKWMLFKRDSNYGDVRDMPKFSIHKLASGFVTRPRVVSHEKAWQQFWALI